MTLTSIVVNLLPVILVIGVWLFFMGRMKKAVPGVEAQTRFWADYLEETRQLNRNLDRVATALEARNEAAKP